MITSYDTMPLGIYSKILEMAKDTSTDADLSIVSLLTGITEEQLMSMPLTDFLGYKGQASFLYHLPNASRLKSHYQMGGFSLTPIKDYRYLTTAQYIDFKEYAAMDGDHMVELLSVLLVPEGKSYNEGYDILEVQAAIREHLTVTDAIALRDFFIGRLATLTAASLTSLERQMKALPEGAMKTRAKAALILAKDLFRGGVGSAKWMLSLNLPVLLLRRYIDSGPWSSSISSVTAKTRKKNGKGNIVSN